MKQREIEERGVIIERALRGDGPGKTRLLSLTTAVSE